MLAMLTPTFRWRQFPVFLTLLALVAAGGCHREEIAVYEAPKEASSPPPAPVSPHGGAGMLDQMPPRPGFAWKKLPEGWTSRGPSGMRVANFTVPGPNSGQAELAVIPLPGTGGSDLDLVNLWRSQLSLEPITETQLGTHTELTTAAGQAVKLFRIVGTGPADAKAATNQILVAALRKDGFTWFFKLAGDATSVNAAHDPLKAFLGDVEFTAPEPGSAAPAMAAGAAGAAGRSGPMATGPAAAGSPPGPQPKPSWQVPPDWQAVTAPQMVLQKWTAAASGGSADVTVSVFPGDTGGMTANLNRWRAQVGLAPAPEAELQAFNDNLEVLGGKATLVDFTGTSPDGGQPLRLAAGVVRRDGWSFFYKLLGPPQVVEAHREAFTKFIQTAQYARGS